MTTSYVTDQKIRILVADDHPLLREGLTTDDVAVKLANSLAQLELSERKLQVLDQMAPE
jgi:hypothetical protein